MAKIDQKPPKTKPRSLVLGVLERLAASCRQPLRNCRAPHDSYFTVTLIKLLYLAALGALAPRAVERGGVFGDPAKTACPLLQKLHPSPPISTSPPPKQPDSGVVDKAPGYPASRSDALSHDLHQDVARARKSPKPSCSDEFWRGTAPQVPQNRLSGRFCGTFASPNGDGFCAKVAKGNAAA